MEITLHGAAKIVTGSCYSITVKNSKILVDCGMFQGGKDITKLNFENFGFNASDYGVLLLTHAHLDHCGRIPKLVKEGFKGTIYTTSATKDLARVVMMDSAKLAYHDTIRENRRRARDGLPPREALYTIQDVQNALKLFKTVKYEEKIKVNENIDATFFDAGHILGSSIIQLEVEDNGKKVIVFSGDLGQVDNPIVKDPTVVTNADYVFIESTYGDRLHSPMKERKQKLLSAIRDTYKRGGKLMIPSFAIERAQELLYDINEFVEKGLIPKMKVYIDSPMAIKSTEVFKIHPECYDDEIKALLDTGDNPFSFPGLEYSESVDQSKKIDRSDRPLIVIAGSGMCTGGRIKHHIRNNIENEKNTILFVGYQVKGTLGYWIKNGASKIRLLGTEKYVVSNVREIDSFSAHADYNGLLDWLKHYSPKPKKVFVVHGDPESADIFSKKVEKMGIKTHIPEMRESIIL